MSALPITITTAGLQALVNAQNTGVSNVVIAAMGVSPNQVAISAATTVIPGEVKRLGGVAGMVTAEDTIYVSASDQTQDTYTVRTVALYLADGTLFAAYSQAAPLVEKAGPSLAVLEASVKLTSPLADVIQFEGGGWLNPPASETVAGVLRLATVDEAVQGVSHSKAVTPKGLKAATSAMMAAIQATFDQITQALAGKADTNHQHAAGDVISGTFNEARIPALPQNRITGLIDALAGKAAAVHGHVMADIDGLVQALSGKSAVGHTHAASDTTSGVFEVARIPALAMEKITGLAAALAVKLAIADFTWGNLANKPAYYPTNRVTLGDPNVGMGGLWIADGNRLWVAHSNSAHAVWDTSNFNPATKVDAANPIFTGWIRHHGSVLEMPGNGSFISLNLYYDGGWRRRAADHGWAMRHSGGIFDVIYGPSGAAGQLVGEQNLFRLDGEQGHLVIDGGVVWTTATFNPATKADLASPDFTDNVRLPATTLFKKEVAGASEGGQFLLQRPDTSTTLAHDVVVDLNGDSLRIWERAGAFRGVSLNLAAQDANVGSVIHTTATLKPSTQAEAAAGIATDRFITPAALWSFARDLGPVGWAVIPGIGLMVQWGVSTANTPEGQVHATLPVAFGGGCLVALANPRNPTSNINSDYYMQVVSKHLDRIVFYANRANGSSGNLDGYEWLALGRVSGTPDPAYGGGGSGDPGGGGGGGGGGQVEV